jgi:hypothetical protein
MNFHKLLLKFTKIRMDFQLTNFFGEFYMIISLSVVECKLIGPAISLNCRANTSNAQSFMRNQSTPLQIWRKAKHVRSSQSPQRISYELPLKTLNSIDMHVLKSSPYTTCVFQGSWTHLTFFSKTSVHFVPAYPNSHKPNTIWTQPWLCQVCNGAD